ncbi:hypothetical protein [Dokdonella sp.]|uniref:hypothetical protein n=1 Tax=Dokdonella sp. TaxID=2291710 RepID=UPI003526D078
MNQQETRNLLALSHRLGTTPRRVLIAAARMTEQPELDLPESLRRLRSAGVQGNASIDACERLMLTPIDSYARDALGTALFALWQGSGQTD